ncbi:MAG: gamma-glutamyltransferase [candidate division KSB1 bacterium]|nr:gamma-glutamyltransferase [candidate division KSB1 bacterium]
MRLRTLQIVKIFQQFFYVLLLIFMPVLPTTGQIPASGLVATPDSHATKIAYDILNQGGNAIDAAVAAMYALSVVQPYAAGPGAGGLMLIWSAKHQKPYFIDFREQSPQNVDPSIFYQDSLSFKIYTEYGYQSICTPGMVAGAAKALDLLGTMTTKDVLQPAFALASEGFAVSEALVNISTENYRIIESNRTTSALFFPDWFPLPKSQKQTRPDLALTLKLLATQGPHIFYQGEIANEIIDEIIRNNGLLQLSDFSNYEAKLRTPVQAEYKNYLIVSSPPPSSGGIALIELLKILEQVEISKHSLNSGPYIHLFVEAMKQVFDDRENYMIEASQFDGFNSQLLLSKQHIQGSIGQIDTASASVVIHPIDTEDARESSNGSHISVLDKFGNAVAVSITLNGYFGSAVTIPKYGILLNNAMSSFSSQPGENNSIAPGKRPQTSLTPTIILKNNQPYLILGGNGAERIISTLAQIIINIIEFKLSLNDAILSPRFHYNQYEDKIEMETRIDAEVIDYLKKLGHKINLKTDYDDYFCNAQVILFDPTGQKIAGSDVRQKGMVYVK